MIIVTASRLTGFAPRGHDRSSRVKAKTSAPLPFFTVRFVILTTRRDWE